MNAYNGYVHPKGLYFILPNGCNGILPMQFYGACYGLPLEVLECMSTHGFKHRLQNIIDWRPLKPLEQWICCICAIWIIKYTEDISLGATKSYSHKSFIIFYHKKKNPSAFIPISSFHWFRVLKNSPSHEGAHLQEYDSV